MKDLIFQFSDLPTSGKLFALGVVIFMALIQVISFRKLSGYKLIISLIAFQYLFAVAMRFTIGYNYLVHLFYAIPSLFLALVLQGLSFNLFSKTISDPIWELVINTRNGKKLVFSNIKKGVAIFGAAGSGKTESAFVPIIAHMARNNFAGINYDYKDCELTEITNYFYRDNPNVTNYIVAPARPEISHRLNPVAPKYITSQETVNELVRVFFSNTSGKGTAKAGGNFFSEVPEATLGAVIWRLKNDYPQFCTLPHAIAVCLLKDPLELAEFLKQNTECRIMASPYFDSLAGQDQLAGVKGSLSNEMRKFAFPSVFYLLTGDEVNLRLNDPESLGLMNVVNKPGLDETYSPFISVIISSALNCMRERNRSHSLLLLDEGPTVTLNKLSRVPATLRSYNIGTVYSMQDKVLGSEQQGDITTRAVLANLSYQLIGKANDAESIKYYKQLFAEIEKVSYSKSYDSVQLAPGTRVTESSRIAGKYLNQDFSGLETGEFIFLADGKDKKVKISLLPFQRVPLPIRNHVSDDFLQQHYHKILGEAQGLL